MRCFAVAALSLVCVGSAGAEVAYSNFMPGQTFVTGPWYQSSQLGASPELGYRFTAAASGGVTEVHAGLYRMSAGPVMLSLYADGGAAPGALLGSWSVLVPSWPTSQPSVIPLDGSAQVAAGSSYILTVSTPPGGASWVWWTAGTVQSPVMGDQFFRNGTGAWSLEAQPMTAFEVVVPSPGTAILGVVGLAVARRRRR